MDTRTLVETQTEHGQHLIAKLREEGFVLRAAFWAKPTEEDRWSLYLATPALEKMGILPAYGSVLRAFRSLGEVSFDGSNVLKLVSEKDPLAKAVLGLLKRFPDVAGKFLSRPDLGNFPVEGVYIYPLGEVRMTIYGAVIREPIGVMLYSFEKFKRQLSVEVGNVGESVEHQAETGFEWVVAAPEGSKLVGDQYGRIELAWNFRGMPTQSDANEVMALADRGLQGFRVLSEPAKLKTASAH
jgi:hypothetical protein